MKQKIKNTLLVIVTLLMVSACNKFEYSPYQVHPVKDIPENLNNINISKLLSRQESSDDTVTILYSGDSQRHYEDLKKLVTKVNKMPNIDFMILTGDIADFGILQEYTWINNELNKLNIPVMCAIGNHDLSANSGEIYERMYGRKNYSFIYKKYKFIFHDTNGREYGFNGKVPNLDWMKAELNDPIPKWFVGVSHVPPYDVDFDKTLEMPYKNLFASTPGFLASLHGHLHGISDSYFYNDQVRYMTSNSVNKPEALLLKFIRGTMIKELIYF